MNDQTEVQKLERRIADLEAELRLTRGAAAHANALLEGVVPDETARSGLWRGYWRSRLAAMQAESPAHPPLESWRITPTCRINKGAMGAWNEAVGELEIVYGVQQARHLQSTLVLSLTRIDNPGGDA